MVNNRQLRLDRARARHPPQPSYSLRGTRNSPLLIEDSDQNDSDESDACTERTTHTQRAERWLQNMKTPYIEKNKAGLKRYLARKEKGYISDDTDDESEEHSAPPSEIDEFYQGKYAKQRNAKRRKNKVSEEMEDESEGSVEKHPRKRTRYRSRKVVPSTPTTDERANGFERPCFSPARSHFYNPSGPDTSSTESPIRSPSGNRRKRQAQLAAAEEEKAQAQMEIEQEKARAREVEEWKKTRAHAAKRARAWAAKEQKKVQARAVKQKKKPFRPNFTSTPTLSIEEKKKPSRPNFTSTPTLSVKEKKKPFRPNFTSTPTRSQVADKYIKKRSTDQKPIAIDSTSDEAKPKEASSQKSSHLVTRNLERLSIQKEISKDLDLSSELEVEQMYQEMAADSEDSGISSKSEAEQIKQQKVAQSQNSELFLEFEAEQRDQKTTSNGENFDLSSESKVEQRKRQNIDLFLESETDLRDQEKVAERQDPDLFLASQAEHRDQEKVAESQNSDLFLASGADQSDQEKVSKRKDSDLSSESEADQRNQENAAKREDSDLSSESEAPRRDPKELAKMLEEVRRNYKPVEKRSARDPKPLNLFLPDEPPQSFLGEGRSEVDRGFLLNHKTPNKLYNNPQAVKERGSVFLEPLDKFTRIFPKTIVDNTKIPKPVFKNPRDRLISFRDLPPLPSEKEVPVQKPSATYHSSNPVPVRPSATRANHVPRPRRLEVRQIKTMTPSATSVEGSGCAYDEFYNRIPRTPPPTTGANVQPSKSRRDNAEGSNGSMARGVRSNDAGGTGGNRARGDRLRENEGTRGRHRYKSRKNREAGGTGGDRNRSGRAGEAEGDGGRRKKKRMNRETRGAGDRNGRASKAGDAGGSEARDPDIQEVDMEAERILVGAEGHLDEWMNVAETDPFAEFW
ncbi:MAG: hypothetical protein M1824_000939 [Vezdaea acicularis]|nr:MAG: hypothetical protein M1824_000939 [Vezdaea acicularis]